MSDNPMLTIALRHGKLPHLTEIGLCLNGFVSKWVRI